MNTCEKCYGNRWLYAALRWPGDVCESKWVPFDRGNWQMAGALSVSVALATRTLRECSCNPRKLNPWSKQWDAQQPAIEPAKGGASDGSF